jgi:hypothetical protein
MYISLPEGIPSDELVPKPVFFWKKKNPPLKGGGYPWISARIPASGCAIPLKM